MAKKKPTHSSPKNCGAFHSLLEFLIADVDMLHDFVHRLVDKEPFICGWGGAFAEINVTPRTVDRVECNDALFFLVSVPRDMAKDIQKKIEGIVEIEFERVGYGRDTD